MNLLVSAVASVLVSAQSPFSVDPAEVLATFEIHPDFQIELVAAEPIVADPVDLEFDEQGRPFVIEMPGYPFPEQSGNLVLLKDEDGDGVWETRSVYAEGFEIADSLLPYDGGFLVASPPDLLFLKDTDGDDVADVREVLLTGFASANQQHNFNGLTHGLDNWIYGANGGNSGSVHAPGDEANKIPLRFDDFRFDPRSGDFERYGRSTGGFEIALDDYGRYFGTHNLEHISQLVFPGHHLEGLPAGRGQSLVNISDHEEAGTSRIYPIGEQETRVNHPEQSGYFSGACGIRYYGGGAFGEGFNGNVFICDVVLNLIHRDTLNLNGTAYVASRADQNRDFLASTDRAFRPVNMTVDPDGALYAVDMHRAVIEHPEWIPDEMEVNLDLNAGKDKGRIFRITPKDGLPLVNPTFSRNNLAAVVEHLGHPNKWWRDTAQRLLIHWRDEDAIPALKDALRGENTMARLHAMWTLEGLAALDDEILAAAISDPVAGVRENALIIAEGRVTDSKEIREATRKLANDPDARVRMFAALALGNAAEASDVLEDLMRVAEQGLDDQWTRLAVLKGFRHDPSAAMAALLERKDLLNRPGADALLGSLANMAGKAGSEGISPILTSLHEADLPPYVIAGTLAGLADGLEGADAKDAAASLRTQLDAFLNNDSLSVVREAWRVSVALALEPSPRQRELLARARSVAADFALPAETRVQHLALLEFAPFEERKELLFDLLDTRNPAAIQIAAIRQLSDGGGTGVAERLIAMWDELGRDVLSPASDILLYQRPNHPLLLSALEDGRLAIGQLNMHLERRRVLLHSGNDEIRTRAEKLFTDAGVVTRKEALDRMRPALTLSGDASKGRVVFEELCLQCHRMGDEGVDLGPALTDIYRKSKETLLHDIVDPNAAVDTAYVSYAIETNDGRFASGIIAQETEDTITLREALGLEHTFRREEMKEMFTSGLSIMPEEMEADMDPQTMADLLAYLQQPK